MEGVIYYGQEANDVLDEAIKAGTIRNDPTQQHRPRLSGIAAIRAMNEEIDNGMLHDDDEDDEDDDDEDDDDEDEAIDDGTRGKRRAAAPDPGVGKLKAEAKRQKASIAELQAKLEEATANNREVQAELNATAQEVNKACAQAAEANAQAAEANAHKEALSQELKDLKAPADATVWTCCLCDDPEAKIMASVCEHAVCHECVGMDKDSITNRHRFVLAFGLTGEDPDLKCPACNPTRQLHLAEIQNFPQPVFEAGLSVTSDVRQEGIATKIFDAHNAGKEEAIKAWMQNDFAKFATDNRIGIDLGTVGQCPWCNSPWIDHDACLAVQCCNLKCQKWSCGLCEDKCGSGTFKEAHDHLRVCAYNPDKPHIYPTLQSAAARAGFLQDRARQKLAELRNLPGINVCEMLRQPATWAHVVCHGPHFFVEVVVRPVVQGMDDDQCLQLMRELEVFENTRDPLALQFNLYDHVLIEMPDLRELVEAARGEGVPEAAPGEGVAEAGELTAGDEQIAEAFAAGLFNNADVHRLAEIYPNIDRAHIVQVYQRNQGCMFLAVEELLGVHL